MVALGAKARTLLDMICLGVPSAHPRACSLDLVPTCRACSFCALMATWEVLTFLGTDRVDPGHQNAFLSAPPRVGGVPDGGLALHMLRFWVEPSPNEA